MRKAQKKQAEDFVKLLEQALDEIRRLLNKRDIRAVLRLLADCQDGAVSLGNLIEKTEGESCKTVLLLEDYCEFIYQFYEELTGTDLPGSVSGYGNKMYKRLLDPLLKIKDSIRDIRVCMEVVFLPYQASMWDSLESVWKAADEDPDCNAYVIPIPYYDRNPEGGFGEQHYEGDQYPSYVPITRYGDYDFEKRRPDVIFIHNPYDEYNCVTSVSPYFYSQNLKQFTEKLVYIPYFVLEEVNLEDEEAMKSLEDLCLAKGVFNADRVILQSENMRQAYIRILLKNVKNTAGQRRYWEEKILALGSPKADKVRDTRREELKIPEEWRKVIQKPSGGRKRIILYNISISTLLKYNEKVVDKMRRVFEIFKRRQDETALLWRPHPLIPAAMQSMRPQLWEDYDALVKKYREEGWGIYDDTPDVERAVILADRYYGDPSSVVQLFQMAGKLVLIQNMDMP